MLSTKPFGPKNKDWKTYLVSCVLVKVHTPIQGHSLHKLCGENMAGAEVWDHLRHVEKFIPLQQVSVRTQQRDRPCIFLLIFIYLILLSFYSNQVSKTVSVFTFLFFCFFTYYLSKADNLISFFRINKALLHCIAQCIMDGKTNK